MTINYERRSRQLAITLKQHSWALETLRERNRMAMDDLTKADEDLHEIEAAINDAETTACRDMGADSTLDVAMLLETRRFLDDKQSLRRMKVKEQQRASQRQNQAEVRLKEAVLFDKALKQVKETSDREIIREREKRLSEQNTEIWMQRYGRDLWKMHR